jgi:tetratricopeptide (TPR) repeat protein
MEDGRYDYANLLGREAENCCVKYIASDISKLNVNLREVQYYIDSDKKNIGKALSIIEQVNKTLEGTLLYGQFTLWECIAEFWRDKFDTAIELMKKASRIFINYDEQEELIYLADNWIGYTYYRKADFVQAEYWMKISLEGLIELLSKELKDNKRRKLHQRVQYSLGNLAMLYRYTGKFIEASRYAETAHAIVKSLPRNKKEILRSLNTLSHVLAIAGRTVDARCYLEEAEGIYKEIPDRLLGGRLYSTFCQLSYGTMEFANLLECYRAEELHRAVENSHGSHAGDYIEYAEKAIQLLEQEPVFHKELADAYFSLGELYMMMPAKHSAVQEKGDKWELAEQAFEKALKFAKKSQFQYRVVDTLESLVTLYYFQSQTKGISLEQNKECAENQMKYQNEIEKDWKINQYPNLAGRYELTQGDIHFDKALEQLKAEYPKAEKGVDDLLKAFNHYIQSAACKKKFNINRYYLMLRVIYNRLDKLVELAHPLKFSRLESLDYEQEEEIREEPLISPNVLKLLENEWKDKEDDFRRMFHYAHLLGKKKISKDDLEKLEKEQKDHKKAGAYWQAVLVNKCLIELHWTQAHLSNDIEEKEEHLEQVVLHLNRHSRQYRLMGDSFHAKRSYERAEKVTARKITSNLRLKKGLEGYTEIVKGEYFLQRVEFATLLESLVAGELEAGRKKFEEQFSYTEEKTKEKVSALEKASECFKNGRMQLEQALQDENQSLSKQEYENKLSEAYFMTSDIFILREQFSDALNCLEKCMKTCPANEDDCRLDDAKQSYLSVFYFSSGTCGSLERKEKYEQELEEKIQAKECSRPWVAARFRITQGDMLFSECYEIDKPVISDSSHTFKKKKETIERMDLVRMFRKYIEACNYKAGYNELSFEAGLRVLRRRIEMIPDSESLDILRDIFRHLWQDADHLREKKEELDSILQLIRMRSLILQHEKQ